MYEPLGVSLSTSTFPASPCGMWGQLRPRWCPVALGTIPAKQAHCTWTFNFNCWKMRGDAPVLILQALHPASQERPCPLPRPHRSRATGGHQGGSLGMALGGLGPRSQGQGREGASGVWCRAEQCQCLFLGVTQPCNYAEPRGAGAGATMLALARRPGKRPFNCHCHARHIASGGLRLPGSQLACHLPAQRGRERAWLWLPWLLAHWTCCGSPCRQAQSHCLPSDKKCGLVFSLLEKMSGPRTVSVRQEEPGAGEGLYWPTLPPGAPPTCCQPGLGEQAGDLCPASHLTGSGSPRPGQGPQVSLSFPDRAGPEPWVSTMVSGVPRSPPNKRVTQQCQEDARPPLT